MSFYITLPSHSNRSEFPKNRANWFKVRLPQPLRLHGGNWLVGLSSISLPDTGVNIFHLVSAGHDIIGTSCYRKTNTEVKYSFLNMKMEDLKDDLSIVDGVTFMKSVLRVLDQKMTTDGLSVYGSTTLDNGKNTCLNFSWNGDELLLDNAFVGEKDSGKKNNHVKVPHFAINAVLAEKMGWFQQNAGGEWILGTNLKMKFIDGKVPAKNAGDFFTGNNAKDRKPLYWKVTQDANLIVWIWLNRIVSWEFINLNVAFRKIVKEPTRSLHVYSDVGGSTVVGNRMADLLREIKFKTEGRGVIYFEPLNIQYLPLRKEVVEFIEVQVAETSGAGGDLVPFVDGDTILTLHFKKG